MAPWGPYRGPSVLLGLGVPQDRLRDDIKYRARIDPKFYKPTSPAEVNLRGRHILLRSINHTHTNSAFAPPSMYLAARKEQATCALYATT